MCGRYGIVPLKKSETPWRVVHDIMAGEPRVDVRPTEPVPTLRGELERVDAQWWLIPRMAPDPAAFRKQYSTFNARVDRLSGSRIFGPLWKRGQRCVLPMSGYYEWTEIEGSKKKQRWWIAPEDGRPLFAAGLWERWEPRHDGLPLESCTMLVDEALPELAHIHDRRPILVPDELLEEWLTAPAERAAEMLTAMVGPSVTPTAVPGPIAVPGLFA